MEHLDLNSEVQLFPGPEAYQDLLQPADSVLAGHGPPPLRRKGRSSAATFYAPRTEGGRTKTGRKACQGVGEGGGHGKAMASGSGSGGRMRGSIPNGAGGGGGHGGSMSRCAGCASGRGMSMSHDALGATSLGARVTSMSREEEASMEPCRTGQWAVARG